MRVTITKANVFSPFGVPFAINSIQTVPDDYGRSLILSQQATDTDNVLALAAPAPFDAQAARWADAVPTALIKPDGTTMPMLNVQSGIPIIIPSSGSFAANGALSGLTALGIAYPNCYMFFPAGAIYAGSAAGFYFAQMLSTTTANVFNNLYVSGQPTVPVSPQPFVCAGPGAYAQTTGAIPALSVAVPGNSMGVNGRLRFSFTFTNNNSAGNKTPVCAFGGTTFFTTVITTNLNCTISRNIFNSGVANVQVTDGAVGAVGPANAAAAPLTLAVDTTISQNVTVSLNLAVATDWIAIVGFGIELR